ncbi:hypothetical protein FBU30_004279 [Linnemannia zychae]|nr:hypothetical protein FBU30_004279 [Linnemannia zychae]
MPSYLLYESNGGNGVFNESMDDIWFLYDRYSRKVLVKKTEYKRQLRRGIRAVLPLSSEEKESRDLEWDLLVLNTPAKQAVRLYLPQINGKAANRTVVEDVLYEAGQDMKEFHPIHSFILDLNDRVTRQLFSEPDWSEICNDLPIVPPYTHEASDYLDKFDQVHTLDALQKMLDNRPRDVESQLIHECLSDDSGSERKRIGTRTDLVWRTLTVPETDWAIAEAAKVWCPQGNKYITESKFKLPRQLHDILIGRTMEIGGSHELRDVLISGLIIGDVNDTIDV